MRLPKLKLSKAVWGSVSLAGAGCTLAGYLTVQASDIMDSRAPLTPAAQCTITDNNFQTIAFYAGWTAPDRLPETAEFHPYSDPYPQEIEYARENGQPTPQGGAEQAIDDCIAYIEERDGVGLRSVKINVSVAGEHGFSMPITIGQHPVASPEAKETMPYRLGNSFAANDAVDHLEDYRDLVSDMRRAFEAENSPASNTWVQIQRRYREEITDQAAEGGAIMQWVERNVL